MGKGYGKIILFGEHAIVYGYPALAVALDKGIRGGYISQKENILKLSVPTWNIESIDKYDNSDLGKILKIIENNINPPYTHIKLFPEIPSKAGLGSSASTSVAIIKTLLEFQKRELNLENINNLAFECEKVFHSTPSGIDNTLAVFGGYWILFNPDYLSKNEEINNKINVIKSQKEIKIGKLVGKYLIPLKEKIKLVVINTQYPRNTKKLVEQVRELLNKKFSYYSRLLEDIGKITLEGYYSLKEGNFNKFGELLNSNQELLRKLNVSSKEIEECIEISLKAGALGAKLTGAGGGGCVIAFGPGYEERIKEECIKKGYPAFIVSI